MTSPELIAAVARSSGTSESQAAEVIQHVFGAIAETILSGVPVSVADFATFEVYTRREKRGRNPRTGARITIPAKGAIRFTPTPALRRRAAQQKSE
jgi:DNA-binding protein HU-beta